MTGRIAAGALGFGLAATVATTTVQAVRLRRAQAAARERLASLPVRTAKLSHGPMTYLDVGQGTPLVSFHGLYGGYDQALDNARSIGVTGRVIAPSRFGYLGSAERGDATPADQVAATIELLDRLGVERAFILGASAGGTPAIRMAIDRPERVTGLILLSSAPPWAERPARDPGRQGPPSALNRDWIMWMLAPVFRPLMGMDPGTVRTMLPLSERARGAEIDATITNTDMARHPEAYPIELMAPPVLLIHAVDDRLSRYYGPDGSVEASIPRYPHLTTAIFQTGGHLIRGQGDAVKRAVIDFIAAHEPAA